MAPFAPLRDEVLSKFHRTVGEVHILEPHVGEEGEEGQVERALVREIIEEGGEYVSQQHALPLSSEGSPSDAPAARL